MTVIAQKTRLSTQFRASEFLRLCFHIKACGRIAQHVFKLDLKIEMVS